MGGGIFHQQHQQHHSRSKQKERICKRRRWPTAGLAVERQQGFMAYIETHTAVNMWCTCALIPDKMGFGSLFKSALIGKVNLASQPPSQLLMS